MTGQYRKHSIFIDKKSIETAALEKREIDTDEAKVSLSIFGPGKVLDGSFEVIPTFSFTLLNGPDDIKLVSFELSGEYLSKFFETDLLQTASTQVLPLRAWISDDYVADDKDTVWGVDPKDSTKFLGTYANMSLLQSFVEPYFAGNLDFFNFIGNEKVHAQTYTGIVRNKVIMNTAYLLLDEAADEFQLTVLPALKEQLENGVGDILNIRFTNIPEGPELEHHRQLYTQVKEVTANYKADLNEVEEVEVIDEKELDA